MRRAFAGWATANLCFCFVFTFSILIVAPAPSMRNRYLPAVNLGYLKFTAAKLMVDRPRLIRPERAGSDVCDRGAVDGGEDGPAVEKR
jgi:hypothetical protein